MAEPLTKFEDANIWYENEERIKKFLESFRRADILKPEVQAGELSWFEIVERS